MNNGYLCTAASINDSDFIFSGANLFASVALMLMSKTLPVTL